MTPETPALDTPASATPASDTPTADAAVDLIDRLAGLADGSELQALRHQRDKVAAATAGSYAALFDPALVGLTLVERLLVALYACRLTPVSELAAHYRERLHAERADPEAVAVADSGSPDDIAAPRLGALLSFTRTLIENPVAGDRSALHALPAAGITTSAVVALAQLIAFLSYQTRVVVGLRALDAASTSHPAAGPAVTTERPLEAAAIDGASAPRTTHAPAPAGSAGAIDTTTTKPANTTAATPAHAFTMQTLGWKAWLDVVDLASASPQQIAVLEESHPQAKVSEYYRLLVHEPEILRQRSAAFNAIMYAPGGLPRAERELAATVVSRINGCIYCASVHAQRFEQLAKRRDTIEQVFADPHRAGTDARERAIAEFSVALTAAPVDVSAASIHALQRAGLTPLDIIDLIHAVAIFAWANRLMLNLGEPVWPDAGVA